MQWRDSQAAPWNLSMQIPAAVAVGLEAAQGVFAELLCASPAVLGAGALCSVPTALLRSWPCK